MRTESLQQVLTEEQRQAGYFLTEDEDFVQLFRQWFPQASRHVATFNAHAVTAEIIRAAVEEDRRAP